ncbi:MAG: hypothetical protein QMB26_00435, partial [Pseudomonadales bacterium]
MSTKNEPFTLHWILWTIPIAALLDLNYSPKTVRAIGLSGYHRFMGQYALASERLSEAIESAANHCCA